MSDAASKRFEAQLGWSVLLAAVIAFATALTGTFVYDDIHSVSANPGVQSLANLPSFFVDPKLFSSAGAEMYRPVLLSTFAVDWALGGGSPLPFKLTSVLVHAVATWMLFRLCRGYGASLSAAALAGLWFAVHPLASETVNMVSARSESLLLFGLLLALVGHRSLLKGSGRGAVGVVMGAIIACGSKETGVVLPVLLLAQEWLVGRPAEPNRARWGAAARRLWPAVAVVIAYLLVRKLLLGQATVSLLGRAGHDPMYGHTRDLLTQIATMGAALPGALLQLVVPVQLTLDPRVDYYQTLWALPVLGGWFLVIAATALAVIGGRRHPAAACGVVLAWSTALPWILVPLNVPLAEHRLYGVLAGVAMMLAAWLDRAEVGQWLASVGRMRWRRRWPAVLGVAALAALALGSSLRSLDYRDEAQLWRSALRQDPLSFRAHWGLGLVLHRRGEHRVAESALAQAVALYPRFRGSQRAWIETMLQLPDSEGWPYRVLVAAEELLSQKDDDPYYRLLHANALLRVGILAEDPERIRAAEAGALSCLEVGKPKSLVFRLAAECRQRLGDLAGGLAHLNESVRRGLDPPALRAQRSELLRAMGRTEAADEELRAAYQQAPRDRTVRAAWLRRFFAAPR